MTSLFPSFKKAIERISWLIENFGKEIEFIKRIEVEDKRDPSKTTFEIQSIKLKGLWRYTRIPDQTVGTEAGDFDLDKVIVTLLRKDYEKVKDYDYFKVNGVPFRIQKETPAVGFETETDRFYIVGQRRDL